MARSRLMVRRMNMTWNFQRFATLASAAGMLAVVGCASTRYDRTAGEAMDDRRLERRVYSALNAQPVYKYEDVKVNTFRGVVQLSGFAATEAQRDAATEIAKRVRGVGEVENSILIAPLQGDTAWDYVPGRDNDDESTSVRANHKDRSSGGAPSGNRTSTGSVTNSATR